MQVPGESSYPTDQTRTDDDPESLDGTTRATPAQIELSAGTDPGDDIDLHGPPRVGELFNRRYRVERKIADGGMGSVWLIRHLELDTLQALKVILSDRSFDRQTKARFRQEAKATAMLSHPNVVTVHDAQFGQGGAFIIMEYIRGTSLNNLLDPGVPMPLDWIGRILDQLCDVLQYAHDNKIVHRDLKPSNLMLVENRPEGKELLKVLDFGIAKIIGAETTDVRTHPDTFIGSAPWTSPEQATGGAIDGRSDLYSVGIILYEMVTGVRPFNGNIVHLISAHLNREPPRFATVNPTLVVPPAVEQVVLRCLAKKPEDRPQSALKLAAEFLEAIGYPVAKGTATTGQSSDQRIPVAAAPTVADYEVSAPDTIELLRSAGQAFEPQPAATQPDTLVQAALGRYPTEAATNSAGSVVAEASAAAVAEPVAPPRRVSRSRWFALAGLVFALAVAGLAFVFLRDPLPPGYRAEGGRADDGWPLVIVRVSDQTRFIRIPGGTFTQGNDGFDKSGSGSDEDRPARRVSLSGYYLQETEVTNGELDAYFRAHEIDRAAQPRWFQEAWDRVEKVGRAVAKFPAVGIRHELATRYAESVGGKLPTEAQWEYAARSRGKPRRFIWEGDEMPNRKNANIDSLATDLDLASVAVGSFSKDQTEQGIHDLTGNVREWCRDRWAKYVPSQAPLTDPAGPDPAGAGPFDFVVRGGSFATWADLFRTTRPRRIERDDHYAQQLVEDQAAFDVGFRVVIEWPRQP